MSSVEFNDLRQWAREARVDHSPSEIHGLVTGWICAGAKWHVTDRAATLQDWLGAAIGEKGHALFDRLYDETIEGLGDEALAFHPLLPSDDVPLDVRAHALSRWCGGFLAGFGMTGRFQDSDLGEDLREVFEDLAQISALSEEIPDDEENETDLTEIAEYVRMSAILAFTECAQRAVH